MKVLILCTATSERMGSSRISNPYAGQKTNEGLEVDITRECDWIWEVEIGKIL